MAWRVSNLIGQAMPFRFHRLASLPFIGGWALIIAPGILVQGFPGTVETALTTENVPWFRQLPPGHDIS
jgi:hypothetical protein